MGLDVVELVMAIEDEFGIEFRAVGVFPHTVGELHELIRDRLNQSISLKQRPCPTIPVFFTVRDCLGRVLNQSLRIRPSSQMEILLPQRHRRRLWDAVQQELSVRLPPLKTPSEFEGPIFLAWLASVLLILLFGWFSAEEAGLFLALVTGIPAISILTWIILRSMPAMIPVQCATVGHLVQRIMPSDQLLLAGSRTDEYNWKRLLEIISDQLDVPLAEIHADSHFTRDLKCD